MYRVLTMHQKLFYTLYIKLTSAPQRLYYHAPSTGKQTKSQKL